MPPWKPNRERLIAREEARQREEAAAAARVLVGRTITSLLKSRLMQACREINIHHDLTWKDQMRRALHETAERAMLSVEQCEDRMSIESAQGVALSSSTAFEGDVPPECFPIVMTLRPRMMFRAHVQLACEVISVPSVIWANLPKWPKTLKEKKKSDGLHALASNVQMKARAQSAEMVSHGFKAWQSLWHFSQHTLRELAKEVASDLCPHMHQADLRRAATFSPMHYFLDASGCGSRHRITEEFSDGSSSQARHLDLCKTATWPPMATSRHAAAQSKSRSKHKQGSGFRKRW